MLHWLRILLVASLSALERLIARALVFLTAFAVVGLVIVIGGSLLARPLASVRERRLDLRWDATTAPLLSLPQRVVAHAATPAATKLEAAAAELGIELAPPGVEDRARPQAQVAARWTDTAGRFAAFSETLVATSGSLQAPHLDIEFFLTEYRTVVERVISAASRGVPPRWECELARGRNAPRPSEAGLRDLQRVLAAETASRWHRGDMDGAAEVLAAAWRLNRSALERPEMASFTAALQTLAEHLALLRGMDPPPSGWHERLAALDLESRCLELVQVESWLCKNAMDRGEVIEHATTRARFLRSFLGTPFRRLAALDHAEAMRLVVEQLPQRDMSTFQRGAFDAEVKEAMPRWNSLARRELLPLGATWQRTEHAVAGVELAQLILTVYELDSAGDRQILDDLAGARESRVLGMKWLVTVDADRLTSELDGEPFPQPHGDWIALPLGATVMLSVAPLAEETPDVAS